uniref:Uncharacterized protein n=1 Tax=Rhizophagus irregularis (strain DAOM 181602 / DAOM 197198 / MUCL 43194) TaxID=747089 RepID=U9TZU2_RHIID
MDYLLRNKKSNLQRFDNRFPSLAQGQNPKILSISEFHAQSNCTLQILTFFVFLKFRIFPSFDLLKISSF